jgi:hypothetical protein
MFPSIHRACGTARRVEASGRALQIPWTELGDSAESSRVGELCKATREGWLRRRDRTSRTRCGEAKSSRGDGSGSEEHANSWYELCARSVRKANQADRVRLALSAGLGFRAVVNGALSKNGEDEFLAPYAAGRRGQCPSQLRS